MTKVNVNLPGNGDGIIRQEQPKAVVPQERQIDIAAEMKKSAQQINEQNQVAAPATEPQPQQKEGVQFSSEIGVGTKTIFDAQGKDGSILNANQNSFLKSDGVEIAGTVKFPDGTYVKGALQSGVDLSQGVNQARYAVISELEVGHQFDIGQNMGLNLSAKAQNAFAFGKSAPTIGDLRASAGAALTYQNNNGLKVSAGVEGGVVNRPSVLSHTVIENRTFVWEPEETEKVITYSEGGQVFQGNGEFPVVNPQDLKRATETHNPALNGISPGNGEFPEFDPNKVITVIDGPAKEIKFSEEVTQEVITSRTKPKPKPFVSPKISVEQKLGDSNFTLTGNASLNEVNVGLKYNFGARKKNKNI